MRIGNKEIGKDDSCYIIAEIGMNHDGNKDKAKQLVRLAAEAGVDAIKFQSFRATDIINPTLPANYDPQEPVPEKFTYFYEYIAQYELPYEWHDELIAYAKERGVEFLSTPCSIEALEFLAPRIPAFKIASMDLTNVPFLHEVGKKKKPVILSTGIATLEEVALAVKTLRDGGAEEIAVMHCVANYPAKPEELNLRNIPLLKERFGAPVGFSDHSLGIASSIAAVALGATIVEKHFTTSRATPGPDHYFALEPQGLAALVAGIREVGLSLGKRERTVSEDEKGKQRTYRRSLLVNRDLPKGYKLTRADICVIRPGSGIQPVELPKVLGKMLKKELKAFSPLQWEYLS